jgi:glutaminase A-like protein/uncharacterized protein DUF5127
MVPEWAGALKSLASRGVNVTCHRIESFNPAALADAVLELGKSSDGIAVAALENPIVREAVNTLADRGLPVVTLVCDLSNARKTAYVGFQVSAADGAAHEVQVYLDITGQWAVNQPHEKVTWSSRELDGITLLGMRSLEQDVLGKAGDFLRIDWGSLLLAVPAGGTALVCDIDFGRDAFIERGVLDDAQLLPMPRKATYWGEAVLATRLDLSCTGTDKSDGHVIIGYDDELSVEYFGQRLKPWWRRADDATAEAMMAAAENDFDAVMARCRAFDAEMWAEAENTGGPEYAQLCALAYRQSIAAHKLVADADGQPLFFSKECCSNGCMATVDVTYPSSPLYAAYRPDLLKAMLDPVFHYCGGPDWPHPFPAHDLGVYPKANGQVYMNFHRPDSTDPLDSNMPVEEAGNMMIMVAAIAAAEGHAGYAQKHWALLSRWADYLQETGLDPESQLCTDDFAGMIPHNANLSVKAILGLGAYAQMAGTLGLADDRDRVRRVAEGFAEEWRRRADDGDHYRLAFDQPGSWSQKYNMVWDKVLGLGLFGDDVYRTELAFYEQHADTFGIPLDNRSKCTKPEWHLWVGTLSETDDDFRRYAKRIFHYAHTTPSRVPFSDFYLADTGRKRGNVARSVIGGVFIKLLAGRLGNGIER